MLCKTHVRPHVSPIPIVAPQHPAQINVSNSAVKLLNEERFAAFIDGREVKRFELDVSGHERAEIALHQDLKKLLSYINEQSEHQFAESDILLVNGTFVFSLFLLNFCFGRWKNDIISFSPLKKPPRNVLENFLWA
jgi:hypothetical protein